MDRERNGHSKMNINRTSPNRIDRRGEPGRKKSFGNSRTAKKGLSGYTLRSFGASAEIMGGAAGNGRNKRPRVIADN
jgi:hypothetical protein